ncbi:hypothetical protein H5410_030477 [Solanum commersonii]|uniref:Uncharacterized protein n=1 Tax=Solanum commersonii TaxID=4109 RepID=A0A9J5YEE3_SOLCO|nr:hypothetical protein H5410_030477 [Solanum commersonii]
MSKKPEHTSRKSPRLVESSSTIGIKPSTFSILTQMPPPNKNTTPTKKVVTSQNKNDCDMYTCLFAEYISNGVFNMGFIDIDAKYHRQRYATIIWQYEKIKNEDGAINESEVTGTIASKSGGPRIAKEHARIPAIILHQDHINLI